MRSPVPTDVLGAYVGFGAELRAAGLVVGTGQEVGFARAVARLDPLDRDDVYWAGRCCLVIRADDIATYDRVFDAYFGTGSGGTLTVAGEPKQQPGAGERAAPARSPRPVTDQGQHGRVASSWEVLRSKDFAACTDDELAEARRLIATLSLNPPTSRSRRSDRAATGRRPDLRRVLRDQVGERTRPPRLSWRRPRRKPRPRVLILDVSGSMAAYSRMLLQLGWSARRSGGPVEVFCFGTRLTRVTGALARRDPDDALTRAAGAVVDWDGGTRIGTSIHTYLHDYARRAGCRGAVVVLCSDGLERGDPAQLAAQLARLHRLSHRVIWVNPLAGGAGFEPTARGMAAALPHVDVLVAGHSLASLQHLSRVVSEVV